MLKRKGFYGLVLAIVVLTLFLPACFKLGGEPSINAEFTLTREEIPFFGISEYAFSVDVKGVKDAAVVEFDNGMASIALNGGKAESRFFANIGTEEVTLVVRDSRGVELLKKTVVLEKTVSQFREAALGARTGLYIFDDPDLVFYSVDCLLGLKLWEKSELLDAIDEGLGAYIVVDIPGFVRIYDFNEYPYGDMPLTQDTLVTLELPYFAERFCEGGFFEIVTDTTLYSLDVDWNAGGEVEVVPDPDYAPNLYKEGTEVSLKATADTGFYFGGWTGAVVSSEPEETVVMDEDKVITANFVEESSPYIVGYSIEPDPVCEGTDFEITVEVQNGEVVEITFEGETVVAEKDGDIYTASFTAPMVSLNTFKPLTIKATNVTKSVIKNYAEGIYVLNSEGAIEILDFWYEEFECDDTGTYLYIKTCCNPDPVYFNILVEDPFETEPEFLSKELVPGECAYLITFWWEFGTVACADATLTAVVKDYCGNSDEKELVIENISNLTDEDVIEVLYEGEPFDPAMVPCDATSITLEVTINYFEELNITNVLAYICTDRGKIVDRAAVEEALRTTGKATIVYEFEDLDCEEACITIEVVAEKCGDCVQEFERCFKFHVDNMPPRIVEDGFFDLYCNSTETYVTWEFEDEAFDRVELGISHGTLYEYRKISVDPIAYGWVEIDPATFESYEKVQTTEAATEGAIKWELGPIECEEVSIEITAYDFCCNLGWPDDYNCCDDDYVNSTTWEATAFIDNVAPVIEFDLGDDICGDATSLTFSWTISDCQDATFTGIEAKFICPSDDSEEDQASRLNGTNDDNVVKEVWISEDGLSGTATLTWEPVDCCSLEVTLKATDACENLRETTKSIKVDNVAPRVSFVIEDAAEGVICGTDLVQIIVTVDENCLDVATLTVSTGCLEDPANTVINCKTWKSDCDDCGTFLIDWLLYEIDCEYATVKLWAVDECGNESVVASQTYRIDNVKPTLIVDIEADKCATYTTFSWDADDPCFDEVTIAATPNNLTFDASTVEYMDSNEGKLPASGSATWTFDGLDCEKIELEVKAYDTCGNVETFKFDATIDNVKPELEWEFDMKPIVDPEGLCKDVYDATSTLLTWEATDGCLAGVSVTVTLGEIEHWEDVDPDPQITKYEWVPKGDTNVSLPNKNDESIKGTDTASTSNWRWNIEGIDCENATITFKAWDDCWETVDSEEVLIDNVAPLIELTAPDAECDVDCVDLEWKIIQEKCLTCGVGCTDWWVGEIEVSQGTLDKNKITVACDCTLPATGTVKWCFGDVDCGTTLIATLTVWDAAGNVAVEVVELKDVDNMAPRIDLFTVNPTLKFDNGDPYLEMSWSATDNCPNSVSVWVDQGYLKRVYPSPIPDEMMLAQIEPFEPEDWEDYWPGGPNSFTVDASGMRWYLDDPAAGGQAWIAFQDVCCNEATKTATFEPLYVDVVVTVDGKGTAGTDTTVLYGSSVTVTATPTDDCQKFLGWFKDEEFVSGSLTYTFPAQGANPINLEARFETKQYLITTEAIPEEGGTVDGSATYDCGNSVTVEATPNKGYRFDGWYVDEVPWETAESTTFTASEDLALEAHFVKLCDLELRVEPSQRGVVSGEGTYDCGTEVTIEATPDSCYDFEGWFKDGTLWETEESTTFILNEDTTLVASFTIKKFYVALSAEPPAGGDFDGQGTYDCGELVTLTATPAECFDFVDWYDYAKQKIVWQDATYTFNINEDVDLTARFARKKFDVTVEASPTAGGKVGGGGEEILCGSETSIDATPNQGYRFNAWYLGEEIFETEESTTFVVKETRTLVADFIKTYEVTVGASPTAGGEVGGGGTYDENEGVTVVATPSDGYDFVGWYEGLTGVSSDTSYDFLVTADRDLVAVFKAKSVGSVEYLSRTQSSITFVVKDTAGFPYNYAERAAEITLSQTLADPSPGTSSNDNLRYTGISWSWATVSGQSRLTVAFGGLQIYRTSFSFVGGDTTKSSVQFSVADSDTSATETVNVGISFAGGMANSWRNATIVSVTNP